MLAFITMKNRCRQRTYFTYVMMPIHAKKYQKQGMSQSLSVMRAKRVQRALLVVFAFMAALGSSLL